MGRRHGADHARRGHPLDRGAVPRAAARTGKAEGDSLSQYALVGLREMAREGAAMKKRKCKVVHGGAGECQF